MGSSILRVAINAVVRSLVYSFTRGKRVWVVLALLAVLVVVSAAVARADPTCSWEWGGVVEESPAPCMDPAEVRVANGEDDPAQVNAGNDVAEVSSKVELAGGLLVFLGTIAAFRTFKRGRLPV